MTERDVNAAGRNPVPRGDSTDGLVGTGIEQEPNHPGTVERASRRRRISRAMIAAIPLVAAIGIAVGFGKVRIARLWAGSGASASVVDSQPGADTYYCPMHPSYRSDKPGNCPICSMKLVKLAKPASDGNTAEAAGTPGPTPEPSLPSSSGENQPPSGDNSIYIDPQKQQLIGVRSEPAAERPLVKEVRALGKVVIDESRITHIHTKVTGYVEDVFADYVGQTVKAGQPLFTIYSPDLLATEEEYLLALKAKRELAPSSIEGVAVRADSLVDAARRRLELWDVTPSEIESIEKRGKASRTLTVYSPVSGIVTERAAYHHGKYVTPDQDLYTITDLSDVWIIGQVYEYELPDIKVGQPARVTFPYGGGSRTLMGKIAFIYPYLDDKTRTAQVRMDLPNPGLLLKPDMFAAMTIKINLGKRLTVPQDAVLDSGTEQYVFVDKGDGHFEPRLIKPGPETEGYRAVQSGLRAGERVVTGANFILDSDSRLKGVFASMESTGASPRNQAANAQAAAPLPGLRIEILEPKSAKVGDNPIRLAVRDASGSAINDAQVSVTLFMPKMGEMAPMTSKADLAFAGQGIYTGTIQVPMAWSWQTTVTVRKGNQSLGSWQTTITAR